ncbi:hypothetical protein [Streptomyces fulvoviolaceus]|uniref:hypothetical protein n=1 Tax=Streptomyces fulvoviolaceus TaxID=285535 RepID=UPI0021BEE7A9|nr:hypothetical protein [Streptomyces fulvoviolaceus]MCT9081323.1 hypothetical protein [Streptomyces fulvoviolaceus]
MTADAVALEARKAAEADELAASAPAHISLPEPPGRQRAKVTFLSDWRMAHLPADARPLPSVAPYDQLLRHRRPGGAPVAEGEAT